MRAHPFFALLAGLLLACAAGGAAAQAVYKSTMKDGKIVYGEKPAPNAVKVEQMGVTTRPMSSGESPSSAPTESQQRMLQDGQNRQQNIQQAQAELQNAQQELQAAQQAMQSGVEPLEGERVGTAGGGGRFTDAYQQRQRQLADNLQRAQAKYDAAAQKANSLR
jgi:hypothetical protein